jgi:hypothetical protein
VVASRLDGAKRALCMVLQVWLVVGGCGEMVEIGMFRRYFIIAHAFLIRKRSQENVAEYLI